jgi:hypothetical protein
MSFKPKAKKKRQGPMTPADYFPDLNEWPENWMGVEEDLDIGCRLLALFIPFIQHQIDRGMAGKTIKTHGQNLGILGSEIIKRLNQNDEENRKLSPRELILHYVDDKGGPLVSHWDVNDITGYRYHLAYDSTCRNFLQFITGKAAEVRQQR